MAIDSPFHIRELWTIKESTWEDLRDRGLQLDCPLSTKQWINTLSPIAQTKLFNACKLDKMVQPSTFKLDSKYEFITEYDVEIYQNPKLYEECIKKKSQSKQPPLLTQMTVPSCSSQGITYIIPLVSF